MKQFIFGIIALSAAVFTACNPTTEKQSGLSALYTHYQELTSALANDHSREAARAAEAILSVLPEIQEPDIPSRIWEDAQQIAAHAGNMDLQRRHLVSLSEDIYSTVKRFGTDQPLYKIYCSMYNGDQGAYWISHSKEISNPFHGADMLRCGEIQEELTSAN